MYVDREKALEQGEKLNVVGGPAWRTGFPHETVCCHEGRGGHFCPEISRQACWRAKMPTPARRAAYCWVRKTSAECRATKYWRYFSIAKELSLSKYTSFPWFYWIRDFVTLQNTVFLIDKSGKEKKILLPYNTVFLLAAVFVFRVFFFFSLHNKETKILFPSQT